MRKQEPLIQEIVALHSAGDYGGILEKIEGIAKGSDGEAKSLLRLLSWPSPRESDLDLLCEFIHSSGVTHLYSVGCGTGLLEWLLMKRLEKLGLEREEIAPAAAGTRPRLVGVTGIEIDFGWWSSSYSPPQFLPLLFVDKDFNVQHPFGEETDMALFCYFNNLKVFLDYLSIFQGRFLAILGPISTSQFCAPGPLEMVENPEMPGEKWKLKLFQRFGLEAVDHLAIYEKVV